MILKYYVEIAKKFIAFCISIEKESQSLLDSNQTRSNDQCIDSDSTVIILWQ